MTQWHRLAGVVVFVSSTAALAQFGPPAPGSVEGTESGTYGSSIGFDVRGAGTVDRFGRPQDPLNPTDTGRKPVDPRDAKDQRDGDAGRIPVPANARSPADGRGPVTAPGMGPAGAGATGAGGAARPGGAGAAGGPVSR